MRPRAAVVGVVILLTLGLAALSYVAPYRTLTRIRTAARDHDTDTLRELVDFPAVRDSLKDQLKANLTARTLEEQKGVDAGDPFAALSPEEKKKRATEVFSSLGILMLLGSTGLDAVVDSAVSPSGILAMMEGNAPSFTGELAAQAMFPSLPMGAKRPSSSEPSASKVKATERYNSYSRFSVRFTAPGSKQPEPMALLLRRDGLFSWRLYSVRLPKPAPREHRREPPSPSQRLDSRFWGPIPQESPAGVSGRAREAAATSPSWSADLLVTKSESAWFRSDKTFFVDVTITNRSEERTYEDLEYEVVLTESRCAVEKGQGVIYELIMPGETRRFRRLDTGLSVPSQLKEPGFAFRIVDVMDGPQIPRS